MKRAVLGIVVLLGATPMSVKAGRGNMVHHVYSDGSEKVFLGSAGSCRHHLTAHPLDYVTTTAGSSNDPASCN